MQLKKLAGQGPERISLAMLDPIFAPGEAKSATAPITVNPAGLSCNAELFLGPDEITKVVTSGLVPFTSTGVAQPTVFPVTMPVVGGVAYHVYLDVLADGILVVAYIATEDVVIPSGSVGPIVWV